MRLATTEIQLRSSGMLVYCLYYFFDELLACYVVTAVFLQAKIFYTFIDIE